VPLHPPQIQYGLVWNEAWEAVVGGRQAYDMVHDAGNEQKLKIMTPAMLVSMKPGSER
jgi:hypothetical protein